MDYSSLNRNVIADNIANFNTPGYKTKVLRFEQVLENESGLALRTNSPSHLSNQNKPLSVPAYSQVEESTGSLRIDGNNVNQTTEMIKMLKNNYIFNTSVNAINKEFSLDKIAIGR